MNEITRIHIAKTAYDIEVAAKKQLEHYIKSLEHYTQDEEVLADIEIRITELLSDRGVKPGGVITSDDVVAVRKQLGEPHEFSDGEGDMAVGTAVTNEANGRRLYRSTDTAVLGGVLSGIATYFNVNPLWPRLVFVVLLFASFGFATLVYILAWIVIPPARTVSEKLQLAGKDVTLESIKELNADEETAQPNKVAPLIQRILSVGLGVVSLSAALVSAMFTIWLIIAAATFNGWFAEVTNGFEGLGDGNAWIAWLVFGIVVFGVVLLTALLGLIAYAFLAQKLTKRMVVSGIIITALGITAFAATVGISATQSWRVANESRSMVVETKANLPAEFASITSLKIVQNETKHRAQADAYFPTNAVIRYVVDNGPARYELSALPTAKAVVTVNGTEGEIKVDIPSSFRNSFVQPIVTVYGPAVERITTDIDTQSSYLNYEGRTQDALTIESPSEATQLSISGTYEKVTVNGKGWVNVDSATIRSLEVNAQQNLMVSAGTVQQLSVTQPDVCPSGTYGESTSVTVEDVTAQTIRYNDKDVATDSIQASCAVVTIQSKDQN